MALRPLGKSILFTFLDDTAAGNFIPVTKSGILLTNQNVNEAHTPKWGRALACGNECVDIKPGDLILITPLKWTVGFKHDEVQIWKTDEDQILAITDDLASTFQY